MILFLHNRYRTTGGEERALADLIWLVREHLGEQAELLERDSATLARSRAATALLRGGIDPSQVAAAVSSSHARVVHAHNLNPALGWRALVAARAAGARVVMHLHQYRLVCAVGVCFTQGEECTRCHGRNTLPGVLRGCRGNRAESLVYAAALSTWQRRLIAQVDAFIVPSEFARTRLGELGAPLHNVHVLAHPLRAFAEQSQAQRGSYALVVGRLAKEKGVQTAIAACAQAGLELVVAGEGPLREQLGDPAHVRFVGHVDDAELARLRAGARVAIVPSQSAETFGLAAAEAMAAGLPVVASDVGALGELVPAVGLVPAGDIDAMAAALARCSGDQELGTQALAIVRERLAPAAIAPALAQIYAGLIG